MTGVISQELALLRRSLNSQSVLTFLMPAMTCDRASLTNGLDLLLLQPDSETSASRLDNNRYEECFIDSHLPVIPRGSKRPSFGHDSNPYHQAFEWISSRAEGILGNRMKTDQHCVQAACRQAREAWLSDQAPIGVHIKPASITPFSPPSRPIN